MYLLYMVSHCRLCSAYTFHVMSLWFWCRSSHHLEKQRLIGQLRAVRTLLPVRVAVFWSYNATKCNCDNLFLCFWNNNDIKVSRKLTFVSWQNNETTVYVHSTVVVSPIFIFYGLKFTFYSFKNPNNRTQKAWFIANGWLIFFMSNIL